MRIDHDIIKSASSLFVFSFLLNLALSGQPGAPGLTYPTYPVNSGEKIRLFTDRSIYCVNEKMYFTAEYSCIEELESLSWSNVLYVELIRWNGARLAGMKLKLTYPSTSACVEIPGNIPSGNYYLRAYTRWMRNYPATEYAYTRVKIVNPFRPETDDGPSETTLPEELAIIKVTRGKQVNGINCVTDKKVYKPGEKVILDMQVDNINLVGMDRYCITVVKPGAIDTTYEYFEADTDLPANKLTFVDYLPEIRGITISGEVTDKSAKVPLKDVPVIISETQSGEYFAISTTDERGRFLFSLPDMQKQRDFFVQTEFPSDIHVDNGYCNRAIMLPYIAFGMNKDEMDLIREFMINQQITDRFRHVKEKISDSIQEKSMPLVFYGSKKVVYYTDEYIELPDIKEFIYEIIIEATIMNDNEKISHISMRRPDNAYCLPLLFMDNIRINDSERLLKTPLSRIERVEVINADYMVGSLKFNGIMSFYSRNKDFAGIELNRNSLFFTYDMFSDTLPGFSFNNTPPDERTPDRKNLLYWNPDIRLTSGVKTTISFFTSDCPGDYVVFVRSKNQADQGGIFGECYFSVN